MSDMPVEQGSFIIPNKILDAIFELSGSTDKHKGLVLAVINDEGHPAVFHRADSIVTEFALRKALQDWEQMPPANRETPL